MILGDTFIVERNLASTVAVDADPVRLLWRAGQRVDLERKAAHGGE